MGDLQNRLANLGRLQLATERTMGATFSVGLRHRYKMAAAAAASGLAKQTRKTGAAKRESSSPVIFLARQRLAEFCGASCARTSFLGFGRKFLQPVSMSCCCFRSSQFAVRICLAATAVVAAAHDCEAAAATTACSPACLSRSFVRPFACSREVARVICCSCT